MAVKVGGEALKSKYIFQPEKNKKRTASKHLIKLKTPLALENRCV